MPVPDHQSRHNRFGRSSQVSQVRQTYSVFHQFRKAKFAYGGSILSSSQFLLLPPLSQKMELALKVQNCVTSFMDEPKSESLHFSL
jgi:hypothetical protein